MQRSFVSVVLSYPKVIQAEIDRLIGKDAGPKPIVDYLKTVVAQLPRHRVPSLDAIGRYIKHTKNPTRIGLPTIVNVEESIRSEETALQSVANDVEIMQSYEMTLLQNNKLHLDSILSFASKRINIIDRYQQTANYSTKWESMLKGYLELKVKIIEMKAKLSGELSDDRNIILSTLHVEMPLVYRAFADAIKEVCPEKLNLIMEKLTEKRGIDWEENNP